jgi:hypothetical protein
VTLYHRARTAESAAQIAKEGFKRGSRGEWVYFSTKLDSHHTTFGDHVVVAHVPRSEVYRDNEDQGYSVRVKREHIQVQKTMTHVGKLSPTWPKRANRWAKNDRVMRPRPE